MNLDASAIAKLVAELLIAIHGLSDYPLPAEPPAVAFVAHRELEDMACGRPCEVLGWFPPGGAIYLDDRLDPLGDVGARGILVHEMVHFLQQDAGAFAGPMDCRKWSAKEAEAFDIQIRWLAEQRAPLSALTGVRGMPFRYACDEREEPPAD